MRMMLDVSGGGFVLFGVGMLVVAIVVIVVVAVSIAFIVKTIKKHNEE